MARYKPQFLNDTFCERVKAPGKHFDGYRQGLYLNVGKPRSGRLPSKSWAVRCTVNGLRREIGIGPLRLIPLEEARRRAAEIQEMAKYGVDPLGQAEADREGEKAEFEARRSGESFRAVAQEVFEVRRAAWSSDAHARRWMGSLEKHVFPQIGDSPIEFIDKPEVLRVLLPIWNAKPVTAQSIKQRMSAIFAYAIDTYRHPGPNPCDLSKETLPSNAVEVEHRPSMAWQDVPQFMKKLAKRRGSSARCLEFLILTATRSKEARAATWQEIDLETSVWTIPSERMKMKREHRVPLTSEALAVLHRVREEHSHSELVFPSPRGKVMSDVVFAALYKRMKVEGFTTHGFRSSFKTWAQENSPYPDEISEMNLAHVVGNKVRNAYARSDLFQRRLSELRLWNEHLANTEPNRR